MKKIYLYFFITIAGLFISNYLYAQKADESSLHEGLIGHWRLAGEQTFYGSMSFIKDNNWLTIGTYADTIFRYTYEIQGDILILNDGKKITKNKIALLTKDSLIFSNLLEYKTKQSYFRLK